MEKNNRGLEEDAIHDDTPSNDIVDSQGMMLDEPGGDATYAHAPMLSSLEQLLSCCDSIVRTCLSYRTLTPIAAGRGSGGDDGQESSLNLERQVARWLDAKIFEAERHLHILDRAQAPAAASGTADSDDPRHQSDASSSVSDPTRAIQDMQKELLHRTSQLQLEHRFLTRILISRQAQRSNRPRADLKEDPHDDPQARQLQRGAIRARDRQVANALRLEAALSDIRKQQREAKDECSQLQRDNRELWDAIQAAESERQRGRSSSSSGARLRLKEVENNVLEQLIRDLVLGSSLDWFADDRLRDMVTRRSLP